MIIYKFIIIYLINPDLRQTYLPNFDVISLMLSVVYTSWQQAETNIRTNKKQMKIRKIELNDIKNLSELFNDYRIFYEMESDLEGAKKFLLERIKNKESEIFVAENPENNLIGFVQMYPIFSSTRMKRLWLLNDLFVVENHRGLGVSVLLINKAKELCIETNSCGIVLETAKSNDVGNKLYPKAGFSMDLDHNYYSWNNK
ncbi:ribosomal protein S18 acetylase RimI-like enzyme [Flavobacterium sp. 2]|nr:ribosomal protein S18 acetylase RimI-like enzyme [Flavobacterium sp. 2]